MKKITCALVLTVMLAAVFAGCAGSKDNESDAGKSSSGAQTEKTGETSAAVYEISPYLPEKDYGGSDFVILGIDNSNPITYTYDIDADSENGDVLNDAVYARNRRVEDKFNVNIKGEFVAGGSVKSTFEKTVLAGDHTYDAVVDNLRSNLSSVVSGYALSVDDLKYVDINREWWDKEAIESLEINGKIYTLFGDINTHDNGATWCLLFNLDLYKNNNMALPYGKVTGGSWTLDEFFNTIQNFTRDLNGDGVLNYLDCWGYSASLNTSAAIYWACGGNFSSRNTDGSLKLMLTDEKNTSIMTKLAKALNSGDAILIAEKITDAYDRSKYADAYRVVEGVFAEGRALYYGGCLYSLQIMRNLMQDSDFGVLPLPKYDEKQENYISTMQEWIGGSYIASITVPDAERTGIILEAMSSASVSTLTPAYYDITLGVKGVRDEESVKMLDILLKSKTYDIAYAFNWGNLSSAFTGALRDDTVASTMTASNEKITAAMQDTLDKLK